MRWRRGVIFSLGLVLAGCGDGRNLDAGETTTTNGDSGVIRQPFCVPEGAPPKDYPVTPDKWATLGPDQDVIRAYGDAHPDEFTSVVSEYTMGQRLLAYFTGHLDEHRAALAALVANPNDFAVVQGVHSFRESQAIADAIQNDPQLHGEVGGVTWGTAAGAVGANFRSTKSGRAAAGAVRDKFGDGVCVQIAGHPYPKGAWPDASSCEHVVTFEQSDDVELSLALDTPKVVRGTIVNGTLRVTNHGVQSRSWPGGSDLGAFVLDEAGTAIGSQAVEGGTAMASSWVAAPGATIAIPVRFGTDDCRANADYSLPAGTYDVLTGLTPNGGSAGATLKITES
jgi:hypothetical protein